MSFGVTYKSLKITVLDVFRVGETVSVSAVTY